LSPDDGIGDHAHEPRDRRIRVPGPFPVPGPWFAVLSSGAMELWPIPRPTRTSRLLLALLIGALFLLAIAWAIRTLIQRNVIYGMRSVTALGALPMPTYGWAIAGVFTTALLALLVRRPELIRERTASALVLVFLALGVTTLFVPFGWQASLLACSFAGALLVALHAPAITFERLRARLPDRTAAIALWAVTTAVYSVFSMHRHWWFGSGSWDMGCMVHNVYRASHLLDSTSTVLGNVDYLGDHFMIGIYLLAPFFWISSSGYMLLFVQSLSLAATAPAIFLIARSRGVDRVASIALALAAGFAFGLESAAYFDCHEIALGIGFLAFALWAFEARRLALASVLLFAFALFKESLGAYAVGLGLLAVARGVRGLDRRMIKYGAAWIVSGTAWFVLVNRLLMPALIARANPPEPHETFADFGPTVFEAAINILSHPMKAAGALFVPEDKLWSLAVTFGGLGWLAFLAPEIGVAALPLLAERFLSSKSTMWEMGYHYAAPLTIYAAWASAIAWPRAIAFAKRVVARLGPGLESRAPLALVLYLLAQTEMVNTIGYRHPANFHHWMDDYFSQPARRETNQHAVDFVAAQGRDAKIAVQNRILPHLADRPFVYRLGDWPQADWVLLTVGESAWPYDDGLPSRVAKQLYQSPEWRLVFSERSTAVFARTKVSELPKVEPAADLQLAGGG
jgi:uncharacterized membrane protein